VIDKFSHTVAWYMGGSLHVSTTDTHSNTIVGIVWLQPLHRDPVIAHDSIRIAQFAENNKNFMSPMES